MVMSEKEEDSLNKKHLDLCNKLNLDPDKITASWDNFKSLSKNFVLEGDVLHWLGCSIFVVCNFAQFFCNISKWVEMAHLPEEFHNRIIHLKDAFGVTYSTFKEYYTIFSKIFFPQIPRNLNQNSTGIESKDQLHAILQKYLNLSGIYLLH
ncbi:hypothetical protein NQ317_005330 [Molorchus minor]|uniref:Retinoblastoma-associated protein N-terminal domain-containing protein n=1 Tax=Molorchus minor TaxID=1323400 RepID=A0ABQ9JDY3_9CUCU|nr:hypothetical protein NQ317_005330 [Molorchus minor]